MVHPGGIQAGDLCKYRASLFVRAGQITGADQEFAHDLAAGEGKSIFEKLRPILQTGGMVTIQPALERTVFRPHGYDPFGVFYGRIDLQSVADDAGIFEQACPIPLIVGRNNVDIEIVVGVPEVSDFFQDRDP